MRQIQVRFWLWFVNKLPATLCYYCFMRVLVYSTTGKYDSTVVPELSAIDAVGRYAKDKGV